MNRKDDYYVDRADVAPNTQDDGWIDFLSQNQGAARLIALAWLSGFCVGLLF
jgi:hypothetical protein